MRSRGPLPLLVAALMTALTAAGMPACQREKPQEKPVAPAGVGESVVLRAALTTYADLAYAEYSDAVSLARELLATVDRFLAAPSAEGLTQVRQAWLAARHPYQQTEVFRFYDGPIDRVEMRVNTWPIDEAYVEGSAEGGRLGIIDDARAYPELSTALLSTLNAKEGETSISTGYHVVEFLLWGADTRADGPGDRPYTDYAGQADPAVRRGRYLHLAVELLVHDLEDVRGAWAGENSGNYRAKFLERPPGEALALALKGMGSLSGPELGGERLTVAYETKSQENEHSCFSDNTVNDLADDALGIENVCLGRYDRASGKVHGTGLCDAIATRDRALGERLKRELAASVTAVRAIPSPFDQSMLGSDTTPGRVAISAAIAALQKQTSTLAEVAAAYDVRLSAVAVKAAR